MLTLSLLVGSLFVSPQGSPATTAAAPTPCTMLTAQEVASIIGPAKAMPVMNSRTGGSCMYQNGDKTITVLLVILDSPETAHQQWEAKKRVAAGQDIAGWTTPAYSAVFETPKEHAATVGILKAKTFVEARVIDKTQKAADMTAKLTTIMKALNGRM
jgi:hypothetical protein